jgi:signal transduction histidine kinase
MDARSAGPTRQANRYEHEDTRALVALVTDASELVRTQGEAAFGELSTEGSRWRHAETYVFVLEPDGQMRVHPDPELAGRNTLELEDINGRPIIRGLIGAATGSADKPEGWYHYQWPVPGGLFPRWKSSFVRRVAAPTGKVYIVGSGMYNDRMERAFVVDAVSDAVAQIERSGEAAFPLFRDPTGPYLVKEAYVSVLDTDGTALVHPAFPNLEGSSLLDVQDTQGKHPVREMLEVVQTRESGWVDYMWPRPGDSVSTQKSTYVSRAKLGDRWVVVACGVYLADAPSEAPTADKMTAPELMTLVRGAAAVLEEQGENAFPEFRRQGSKWFHDETYFFVVTMDGIRVLLPPDPASEGRDVTDIKDPVGRSIGRMTLDVANGPSGEGWIHYMFPLPGGIFPVWKSTFVKRVTFPSGQPHAIGCGIYNLSMDQVFIEDVVNRAADLLAEQGKDAFGQLRDRAGPFVFMDTYVFVQSPDGTELVNPALPALEGRNLMDLRDARGKAVIQDQIAAVMKDGSAWLDFHWYRPGDNTPARKLTYVRKVQADQDTFIVGSGIYAE